MVDDSLKDCVVVFLHYEGGFTVKSGVQFFINS